MIFLLYGSFVSVCTHSSLVKNVNLSACVCICIVCVHTLAYLCQFEGSDHIPIFIFKSLHHFLHMNLKNHCCIRGGGIISPYREMLLTQHIKKSWDQPAQMIISATLCHSNHLLLLPVVRMHVLVKW